MRSSKISAALALVAFSAMGMACSQNVGGPASEETGEGFQALSSPSGRATIKSLAPSAGAGGTMSSHGGPVALGTPAVYAIWYGNWASTTTAKVTSFVQDLSGSPYLAIQSTYTSNSGTKLSNTINYRGATTDAYSHGKSLTDADVASIVTTAIQQRRVPADTSGIYFVFTSADVDQTSGFCSSYCAYHATGALFGTTYKYAFVGNPSRCSSACEPQTTSPNGDAAADAMANMIAHEIVASNTDVLGSGWYDTAGHEVADKCAWTFGSLSKTASGAAYNVTMNGRNYLLQQNWVNSGNGFCGTSTTDTSGTVANGGSSGGSTPGSSPAPAPAPAPARVGSNVDLNEAAVAHLVTN